jgi:hypothetical protein
MDLLPYYKSIYYDILKAFWDERGRGSRYRTVEVGVPFCKTSLDVGESTWADALRQCSSALASQGFVEQVRVERDNNIVRLRIKGCVHEGEDRRVKDTPGMEIFCCPMGNVLMSAMDGVLGVRSELAESSIGEDGCEIILVVVGSDLRTSADKGGDPLDETFTAWRSK